MTLGISLILVEVQYLAPVQYYSKFLKHSKVVIEQMEHYSKGSFRNRCVIAMAGGLQSLSIPLVKGKNQQTDIREVRIDYSQNWQQLHWRTVQTAYGSAPFFDYYKATIMQFYEKKNGFVVRFLHRFSKSNFKIVKTESGY